MMVTRIKVAVVVALALLVVLVVDVMTVGAAPASRSDGAGRPDFCNPDSQARDFGFSSLPPIHEADERTVGKELGHPDLSIFSGVDEVRTRSAPFGFRFAKNSPADPKFADLTVTGTLWELDAHGGHAVEVGHTGMVVTPTNLENQPLVALTPPSRRGFYRFDLRIIAKGKTIGTYSSYMKQVPPSSRARLLISPRVAHPGGRIRWRLENLGTEQIDYGEEFVVQRKQDGTWTHVRGFGEGLWSLVTAILEPGAAGGCEGQHLPPTLAPGRYRVVQEAELFHWPANKPTTVTLTAPFTVVAPR
jgi:hypothetical protein